MIDNLKTGDTRLPLSISAPLFAKSRRRLRPRLPYAYVSVHEKNLHLISWWYVFRFA
jgi:hypothetical protein